MAETLATRPPLRALIRSIPGGVVAALAASAVAAAAGVVVATRPEWWRGALAFVLAANLAAIAVRWPRAAASLTLLFLPFLGLIRHLLIEEVGWSADDPLLLVAPVVTLFLLYRLFVVERRPVMRDRLSRFVVALLVLALIQVFNPLGAAGVIAGFGGLIFLAVPLLWFFVGRELFDTRGMRNLIVAVLAVSVAVAAYGVWQTEIRPTLPQWDADWFHITGFGGVTTQARATGANQFRAWSTFSSTTEYSGYLSIGLVLACAMAFGRRWAAALVIPPLALALFWAGGRSSMALTLLTVMILVALLVRNRALAVVVIVIGIAMTYGAAAVFGDRLDRAAGLSGRGVVDRQVGGLLNPLDPNKSTFLGHWEGMRDGVLDGIRNPAGEGSGATNLGARLGGETARETDIDIGDVFVSFGVFGGVLFLVIIGTSFKTVFTRYTRRPEVTTLAAAGVMVVTLGQWLNGGHYAAAALTWLMIGYATRPQDPAPAVLGDEKPERNRGRERRAPEAIAAGNG